MDQGDGAWDSAGDGASASTSGRQRGEPLASQLTKAVLEGATGGKRGLHGLPGYSHDAVGGRNYDDTLKRCDGHTPRLPIEWFLASCRTLELTGNAHASSAFRNHLRVDAFHWPIPLGLSKFSQRRRVQALREGCHPFGDMEPEVRVQVRMTVERQ